MNTPKNDANSTQAKETPDTEELILMKMLKKIPHNRNFETIVENKIPKTVAAAEDGKELPMSSSPILVPGTSIPKKTLETEESMKILKRKPHNRNFETIVENKIPKTVAASEDGKELPMSSSPILVPGISIPKKTLETEESMKILKRKPHNRNFETIVENKIPKTVAAAEDGKELPMPSSPILVPGISIPIKTPDSEELILMKMLKKIPHNRNFETIVENKIPKTVAAAEDGKELPMPSSPILVPGISIPKKTPETEELILMKMLKKIPHNRNFETIVENKIPKTVAAAEDGKELPMPSSPILVPGISIPKKTPETEELILMKMLKKIPHNRNFETIVENKIPKTVAAAEDGKELPMPSSPILVPGISIPKKTPETEELILMKMLKKIPHNRNFETIVENKIPKTVAAAEDGKELPMPSSPILVPGISIPKKTPETEELILMKMLKKIPHNRNFETIVENKIPKTVAAAEEEKELPTTSRPILVPGTSAPEHHIDDETPSTSNAVNNQELEDHALLDTITNIMDETSNKVFYKLK